MGGPGSGGGGARGGPQWESHRVAAILENTRWLMSPRGGGLTLEAAAERLGLKAESLEKQLDRHREPA